MNLPEPPVVFSEGSMDMPKSLEDLPDFLIGTKILECLPAQDLLAVAALNRRFNALAGDCGLWTKLIHLDFDAQSEATTLGFGSSRPTKYGVSNRQVQDGQDVSLEAGEGSHLLVANVSINPLFWRQISAAIEPSPRPSQSEEEATGEVQKSAVVKETPEEDENAKELYFVQLQNYKQFRRLKSQQREVRAARMKQRRRKRALKTLLILCNEKLLVPLMFILLDLTSILLAFWLDGLMFSSVWVAVTPMLLLFLALTMSWICFFMLLARRAQSSVFRGMVFEIQGPVFNFAFNVCGHSNLGLSSGFIAFLCLPLFVCLVASTTDTSAWNFVGAWGGIIFMPVWMVFIILIISPLLRWPLFVRSSNEYASMLLLIWVPLVGFTVLLCLRLEGILQMPIILMMLPIWMVLLTLHFGLLFGVCFALVKDRSTARNIALKLLILLSLEAPFLSFTVLFGLKDAELVDLNYVVVFSPLIATLSFQSLVHVVHVLCHPRVNLPVERDRPAEINLSLDIWRSHLLQGHLPNQRRRETAALVDPATIQEGNGLTRQLPENQP